ncbi:hypothetical protein CAPTEDRAFT_186991 [Capitella teleta]|uniref:G-protein coupled receptors family 1 profile domain-containing protein n=1 Tax=Capitella teleta TaxID=283909 RepID=R7U0H8_CAPTE|nr:hypothetical protein CAPTEDRAFT_186991 [Capitella teleta]|eukprot:ELT99337.1 hypothetical protein CAPTEDRAFT_186991 [Capitella teleta]
MIFLTLLAACACLVEVSGLHATTEATDTTGVAVTEDAFYISRERMLADPIRYLQANGWEWSDRRCSYSMWVAKRYTYEEMLCACYLWCQRQKTQEELDFEYASRVSQLKRYMPRLLRIGWPYIPVFAILASVGICGNITIIVVIARFMGKNKSATNALIANMAVSDLFTCVFCMPIQGELVENGL